MNQKKPAGGFLAAGFAIIVSLFLSPFGPSALRADDQGGGAEAPTADTDTAIFGSSPTGIGIHGSSDATTGIGVLGEALSATGVAIGVGGKSNSSLGYGVLGEGSYYGVYGKGKYAVTGVSNSSPGTGVGGSALATSGPANGVAGSTQSTEGKGVYGISNATTGLNYGIYGENHSPDGFGVYGTSEYVGVSGTSPYVGVSGTSSSVGGAGVVGGATNGSNIGVLGFADSNVGRGVQGSANGESASALYGRAEGQYGKALYAEVTSTHSSANAILAKSGGGSSYAAYLIGRVNITGSLSVQNVPSGDFADLQYNTSTGQLYYDTSSRRYKKHVQELDADFSRILQAKPVQYTRENAPDRIEIGYIAEDMEALGLTQLIGYDGEGQVETFNYEKMILYVVEVLKVQQHTIDKLQAQIVQLKSEQ